MNEDVWNVSSYHINNLMNQVLDITESWMQLCDSLTRLFWPNYGQHPWIGKPHSPQQGHLFKERLSEIKGIKNLYKQIITLLDDHEIRNMLSWNSPFKSKFFLLVVCSIREELTEEAHIVMRYKIIQVAPSFCTLRIKYFEIQQTYLFSGESFRDIV